MSSEAIGWTLVVILFVVGAAAGFTAAFHRLTQVLAGMEARVLAAFAEPGPSASPPRQPIVCSLSGRPIEQCPPEHRHFPQAPGVGLLWRPPASVVGPEQAPHVATVAPSPKPRPTPAQPRGGHWKPEVEHTQAIPISETVKEETS